MRKGQQATTDRIAQLQLIQQQNSYDLFVQQSLWYQMQMQMQTATPHVAYHTTTAQVLYILYRLPSIGCLRISRCRIGQTLFCVFALYMLVYFFL